MERNTLMAKCYPRIKDYCREKHGLEFQVSYPNAQNAPFTRNLHSSLIESAFRKDPIEKTFSHMMICQCNVKQVFRSLV